MSPWLRPPIRRRGPDRIEVKLPGPVGRVVAWSAEYVLAVSESPDSPGFARLFAPIGETGGPDDPLVTLERQTRLTDLAMAAAATSHRRVLTDGEAEAWLKVLGLALTLRAEDLGIRSEADRAALGGGDDAQLDAIHTVQMWLVRALDTPADGPG